MSPLSTTDFMRTLRPEGEHEESSGQSGDCCETHKGRLVIGIGRVFDYF